MCKCACAKRAKRISIRLNRMWIESEHNHLAFRPSASAKQKMHS